MKCLKKTCLVFSAFITLAACQSVTLIEANQEFIELVQQRGQAQALRESGDLDPESYQLTEDALRTTFFQNAKALEVAASRSSDPKNKVSLLNVAVRNYLLSGSEGLQKVPGISEDGWAQCQTGNPAIVTELPTTCAYFLVATPQAVQNEQVEKLNGLIEKIQSTNVAGGASVEDAKTLANSFYIVLAQFDNLDSLHEAGVLRDTGSEFQEAIYRQQDIMFCTADRALIQKFYLPEEGSGWNKAEAVDAMENELLRTRAELSQRTKKRLPSC